MYFMMYLYVEKNRGYVQNSFGINTTKAFYHDNFWQTVLLFKPFLNSYMYFDEKFSELFIKAVSMASVCL